MKTRNKVKLITTIICMVLSLIALYEFCFVVEVAPVWRVILIIIALGWVASGVYNLNEYRKSERRNT